jgi:transcriptional regulator with XRE-family HTH domain
MAGNKQKGSQSHISNMEKSKGEKLPSVEVLRALAIALETNTDYLLGLTDDDRPHGQLDDQVVVTVEDPDERRIIQEATEALVRATKEDKDYIVGLIRRLSPKPPRIIGDE